MNPAARDAREAMCTSVDSAIDRDTQTLSLDAEQLEELRRHRSAAAPPPLPWYRRFVDALLNGHVGPQQGD